MSNFDFLKQKFPVLANLGGLAEKYLYTDPNSCLIKLGMIGETVVNLIFEYDNIKKPTEDKAVNRINILIREGYIDEQLKNILHALRKARNKAVHENYEKPCGLLLEFAYVLSEWFMQTYGDYRYEHRPFILPKKEDIYYTNIEENELQQLTQSALQTASKAKIIKRDKRLNLIKSATDRLKLTEEQTRYIIDAQLREAGWQVDTRNIRYSKGSRPQKNVNMAIAEWPTMTDKKTTGHVDYALFIGLKLVAVVEAKSIDKDILSVMDYQAKEYASQIIIDEKYLISQYGDYKVPFVFATNGRPYLKQIETASGIWFRDLRSSLNYPVALRGLKLL